MIHAHIESLFLKKEKKKKKRTDQDKGIYFWKILTELR